MYVRRYAVVAAVLAMQCTPLPPYIQYTRLGFLQRLAFVGWLAYVESHSLTHASQITPAKPSQAKPSQARPGQAGKKQSPDRDAISKCVGVVT